MRILGIETSFDDTGVAVYDSKLGLLINEIRHQDKIHSKYGGVVPELAFREYIYQVAPLVQYVIKKKNISFNSIDGIAYTAGPGLSGSLLIGSAISCALAYAGEIPVIPVNHMEGHLLSPMIENNNMKFPFIGLLVSGKHTQLINACKFGQYEILGQTLDDAVGEVFDKIAHALHLGYPGGYALSKFAQKGNLGNFVFPKPMKCSLNFNFSFSGLKTFTLNLIRRYINNMQALYDIACEFEYTIFDILIYKAIQALQMTGYTRLVVAGGVSANYKFISLLKNKIGLDNIELYFPSINFCTDNAAMIAYVGMMHLKLNTYIKRKNIFIDPKWSIDNIVK
ncbi:tRNA (adenosine(37)-N6)-threonylcarbamoyltransferase complex transferase subunit TsaD [Buchnera aphidicola]|uniref:tRNA N6-adenosine threonylcarbamoyltransferase n=1 Tax=Buchnera aphidicola (Sarucallis kahawaluokalani) TaxID=1241878 RepID=A0A4D6Y9J0_9GAMM|nr:tRNA (adenosine(37)-N6)-threonylcarbamoyltransferase complex transferase subunit TsaD [Buchnera aphidicola]QCI25852.1 tRNA (adenosine(37)-N6)-threonylcarbamoyltransferase complex transferase subunit TsaD [Buchnera aphidicola (Sarucallis kahawaluokalani)]